MTYGWKCNCCRTLFKSDQKARRPDDNNGGPRCPVCKADGQFTYRNDLHEGDPCVKCNKPHDEVGSGPCLTKKERLIRDLQDAARWRRLPGEEHHNATLALLERAIAALNNEPPER